MDLVTDEKEHCSIKLPAEAIEAKLLQINDDMDKVLFMDPKVRAMFMHSLSVEEKRMERIKVMKNEVEGMKKRLAHLPINVDSLMLMKQIEVYVMKLTKYEQKCRHLMEATATFRNNMSTKVADSNDP
ncbi:uncharacterized protein LOC119685000 [Teleopsis dalmanni]|uniref:uncharacterized protein LOC119662240 n=1 Tax=Teleopsis dalmanni TaxID=139649 RepID=UPI000D32D282|nr:uncharacterized protein LOC119662240 [Teleopsis dalmanni]XP_037954852.1 uncharacterized protein LOC119684799 [Teleopsis dalmanni]XP_037955094.1 uncharacterized protein LOC119685000 [Teleopsis dalmanni]